MGHGTELAVNAVLPLAVNDLWEGIASRTDLNPLLENLPGTDNDSKRAALTTLRDEIDMATSNFLVRQVDGRSRDDSHALLRTVVFSPCCEIPDMPAIAPPNHLIIGRLRPGPFIVRCSWRRRVMTIAPLHVAPKRTVTSHSLYGNLAAKASVSFIPY